MSLNEEEIYQEHILDHYEDPYHRGHIEHPTHHHQDDNPLCGDVVVVTLAVDGDTIKEVKFDGEGCAISTASADLMADAIQGKTIEEARELFREFHACVTGDASSEGLGKLAVFEGVREFPLRVKCVTLVWHTLIAAFDDGN